MTPELRTVQLVAEVDDYPPLDHLGTYSDEPGPPERTIDRAERGDMGRGTMRYFIAANSDYAEEDYERMERYARGGLVSYGIRARAVVSVAGTRQDFTSYGLWGIPSDADADSANEVASEQLHNLREILDSFGIDHETPLSGRWADNAPWSGEVTE